MARRTREQGIALHDIERVKFGIGAARIRVTNAQTMLEDATRRMDSLQADVDRLTAYPYKRKGEAA